MKLFSTARHFRKHISPVSFPSRIRSAHTTGGRCQSSRLRSERPPRSVVVDGGPRGARLLRVCERLKHLRDSLRSKTEAAQLHDALSCLSLSSLSLSLALLKVNLCSVTAAMFQSSFHCEMVWIWNTRNAKIFKMFCLCLLSFSQEHT